MTSSDEYRKLLKSDYFRVATASSSFNQSYWNLAEYLALILFFIQKVRLKIIDVSFVSMTSAT